MKDFKNFSKSQANTNQSVDAKEFEKSANDFMNKRKDKSENQLFDELFQNITSQKANGTFDKAKIEQFAKQIAPMLDKNQRAKLDEVMKKI